VEESSNQDAETDLRSHVTDVGVVECVISKPMDGD
jgi:hypothetical protein